MQSYSGGGVLQLMFRIEHSVHSLLKRSGPALLLLIWGLLIGVSIAFCDLLRQAVSPWPHCLGHLTLASAIILNILFHMRRAAHSSPGFTSEVASWGLTKDALHGWRWCKKCKLPKPPLTHHCALCGRCVLKMDHHCPWLNNCIGFRNYRSFFLLLFFIALGCAYSAPWFFWAMRRRQAALLLFHQRSLLLLHPAVPLLCFSVALSAAVACAVLLAWHAFLVLTGQTTLEFYGNLEEARAAAKQGLPWVNVHDLGWRENFKEVMGVQGRHWWWAAWLLPWGQQRRGNGVWLPTIYDISGHIPGDGSGSSVCSSGGGSAAGSHKGGGGSPFSPRCSSATTSSYFGSPSCSA